MIRPTVYGDVLHGDVIPDAVQRTETASSLPGAPVCCGDRQGGWICTRLKGHQGYCVARGSEICGWWLYYPSHITVPEGL